MAMTRIYVWKSTNNLYHITNSMLVPTTLKGYMDLTAIVGKEFMFRKVVFPIDNKEGMTLRLVWAFIEKEDTNDAKTDEGSEEAKCLECGVSTHGRKIRSLWNNSLCEQCGEEACEEGK